MFQTQPSRLRVVFVASTLTFLALTVLACQRDESAPRGTPERPLRVMLIPAYGGTEDGTLSDFRPLFHAITSAYDLHFDLRVGSSYSAVVEAMANAQVDIAWFGMVSYVQARERGGAELLAVPVDEGEAVYYSGLFHHVDSGMQSVTDLDGKRLALGDPSSSSGFNFPVALLLNEGVNPIHDLRGIVLAGNHAASLSALNNREVDACAAPLLNYDRAVNEGVLDPDQIVLLAKSDGIPNPPLAMHPGLPEDLKNTLREAFHTVHERPEVNPDWIRGEGGKVYERYDAHFDEQVFIDAMDRLEAVDDSLRQEILRRAQERQR